MKRLLDKFRMWRWERYWANQRLDPLWRLHYQCDRYLENPNLLGTFMYVVADIAHEKGWPLSKWHPGDALCWPDNYLSEAKSKGPPGPRIRTH